MTKESEKYGLFLYPEEKIGVGSILRGFWIIVSVLGSLSYIVSGFVGSGLTYLIAGLIWIPMVNQKLKESTGHEFSSTLKFIFMLIIMGFGSSVFGTPSSSTAVGNIGYRTTTTLGSSAIYTGSTEAMFPTKSDLPTQYTMGELKNLTSVSSEKIPAGALTTLTREAARIDGSSSITDVTFKIFKFDTLQNANSYYFQKVNNITENTGYTEINTGIQNCFAYKQDDSFEVRWGEVYCEKGNIFYGVSVEMVYTLGGLDSTLTSMLNILNKKIQ